MTTIRIKLPTIEQVEFKIITETEYSDIRSSFDSVDKEYDEKTALDVEDRLNNGNEWAWCMVNVICNYKGLKGQDSMGCCSYKDEEDFKQSDYYDEMRQAAYDGLIQRIKILKS